MKTRNVVIAVVVLVIAGPGLAFAQNHAVVIGNNDYDQAACVANGWIVGDLQGVLGDVMNKENALENAGWEVNIERNLTAVQMQNAINKKVVPSGKKFMVWFAGHGADPSGNPMGKNCLELDADEFVAALKGRETLVILDSCFGADFANTVNATLGTEAHKVGFITGASKGECTKEDGDKGLFSRCFIEGLNGAADEPENGGNGDKQITAEEAAEYALVYCAFAPAGEWPGQTPTWDGDHADWVIGRKKAGIPTVSEWGLAALMLLALTAGTVIFGRRRAVRT